MGWVTKRTGQKDAPGCHGSLPRRSYGPTQGVTDSIHRPSKRCKSERMADRNLLVRGARWRHKNLKIEVFILVTDDDGSYVLGQIMEGEGIFELQPLPFPRFTEAELEFEFEPIIVETRYDRIAGEDWI